MSCMIKVIVHKLELKSERFLGSRIKRGGLARSQGRKFTVHDENLGRPQTEIMYSFQLSDLVSNETVRC
jgi:hypothetical protein